MSSPAEHSASSDAGAPAGIGPSARGFVAEHEALQRLAALAARGVRHAELFAVANQELAQLVQADAAALLRFEPDETITLLAAWNTIGTPGPVGDREPVNAALRRLRNTALPVRCGPSDVPLTGPFSAELRRLGIRTAIAVPIQIGGQVWGISVAAWQSPAPFPAATGSRMAEFTELIATAISNADGRAELPPSPDSGRPSSSANPGRQRPMASETEIRPFRVEMPDEAIADLRRRIAAWRPPEKEPVDDQSQGTQLETVQNLAAYWATDYDWRACEAKLNALPQFITEIDGLDIHFIHVKSAQPGTLPLIITHGWPGSIIEQLNIIDPLTNPTAHGGGASDAFDVVIPSLPGYGFSGKPTTTGWDPERIARAWAVLMQRLGYTRYVAQGGDWGTAVTAALGRQAPDGLLGIHVNFAQMVPPAILGHIRNGDPPPADLSGDEKRAYEQIAFATYHRGYGVIQGTRPQTVGYSLADTPVGLAAWLLDHDATTYAHLAALFAGQPYGAITRQDWLDNTTLYWLTNTPTSAARLYWQQAVTGANFNAPADVSLPAAVTVFTDEYVQAPRSWTEKAYHNLIYFNHADQGGHFAAWEQPQLFSQELRAAFRTLR